MADYDVMDQRHPEETTGPHDYQDDPVWGDVWNPTPNTWSPSMEPFPQYGADAGVVAYQDHGDVPTTQPMSEQYGRDTAPYTDTTPDVRANLLTDVRDPGALPPPVQVIRHEVHTYETGSELARIRQVQLNGTLASVQPVNILEANAKRKRALVRIIPADPASASSNPNLTSTGVPATITVPAGKTWTLQSISFLYTASAAVATRTPRVTIRDPGGRIIYQWSSSVNLAASQVAQVQLAPGMATGAGGAGTAGNPFTPTGSLAPLTLQPGSTVSADAIGMDAADTITVGTVFFTLASVSNGASVFIAPRDEGGAATAVAQSWLKLIQGDPPIEIKSQSGIDAMVLNSTDLSSLQVYEELIDGTGTIPGPGLV